MRTITEAANELNVSRKKIYNYIAKLGIQTVKNSNGNFIEDKDFNKLKVEIKASIKEDVPEDVLERTRNVLERDRFMTGEHVSDREYSDLKERIEFLESQISVKDEQLQTKDEQIKAKDGQINGLIQSNFNFSKALLPPVNEQAITVEEPENKSWIKKIFKR